MHRRLANRRRPFERCAKFRFGHVTALCLQINLSTSPPNVDPLVRVAFCDDDTWPCESELNELILNKHYRLRSKWNWRERFTKLWSDQLCCMHGAETWATTRGQEARLEVNEMRMLRWMCGVTRRDKIRNEHIRGTTRVVQASKKITEKRLKWGEWKRST